MNLAQISVLRIVLPLCLFTQPAEAQQTASSNLLTNPSLEDAVDGRGWPIGWGNFLPSPTGTYRFSVVDGGRSGNKAALIEGEGTFGAMPANRLVLDRTKRYVARGWVKIEGEKDATADVKLHYYSEDGRYIGQTRVGFVTPLTDQWQFVTVTDRADRFSDAGKIGLAIAATGKVKARFDDLELVAFDKANLPSGFEEEHGITRSPQLALLGRRIGRWKTRSVIRPCAWVPNGSQSIGFETIRWSLGGQFIEGHATNETENVESIFLMTFDRTNQKYRFWNFDSRGNFPKSDLTGIWDEGTRTINFASQDADGVAAEIWLRLDSDDLATWGGIWTDREGKVLLDMTAILSRVNP